ncbi:integrase/recombinase [mine drainage metagenome]|uniref:Integrase/recombinase n=1 Tax=mine drainage metagenome TaxID=410659 RepID=T0ZNS1_9ZZZZ
MTKAIVEEIHDALKEAAPEGTRWRPYVLRSYASTRLLMAEGAGKITAISAKPYSVTTPEYRADTRSVSGGGTDLLKEARAAYKRCEPFLSTIPTGADKDESAAKIKRLLLKVAGYTNAELDKANVSELTDEEIEKMVSDRVGRSAALPTQEVVPAARVAPLLSQGWEVVTAIGPDQVVLRTPNGNGHRPPTLSLS